MRSTARWLLPVIALLILAPRGDAGEPKWRKLYKASIPAVVAGSTADIATSWGRGELNPLLRGAQGTFGARGLALKSALVGGSTLAGWIIARHRHPEVAAVANFGMAATFGITAWRNTRVQKQ